MKHIIYGAVLTLMVAASASGQGYEQRVDRGRTKTGGAEPVEKPNTIRGEKVDVSGVLPHVTRSGINIINPVAGPEHGDGRDNVSRNVVTGEASGLKFIAWEF
jgi:hypothetical protein